MTVRARHLALRLATALWVVTAAAGCHHYVVAGDASRSPADVPRVGQTLRLTFAEPRSLGVERRGRPEARIDSVLEVEGWVARVRGDTLTLSARRLRLVAGARTYEPPVPVQVVYAPSDSTVRASRWTLDGPKTVLVVGMMAVTVVALAIAYVVMLEYAYDVQ